LAVPAGYRLVELLDEFLQLDLFGRR